MKSFFMQEKDPFVLYQSIPWLNFWNIPASAPVGNLCTQFAVLDLSLTIPIFKMTWQNDLLIFVLGILIPAMIVCIKMGPRWVPPYRPGGWCSIKLLLTSIGIPTLQIRWSYDYLVSWVGLLIMVHVYIETGRRLVCSHCNLSIVTP